MSAKQLRAFLFDPSQADEENIVKNVFSTLEKGHAISIINAQLPKTELEKSIIKCDPTEVFYSDNTSTSRSVAIVDNPNLASVCFTSGTTGNPKPVEHSLSALESSTNSLYKILNIQDKTDWLCVLPPYFVAGLTIFTRSYLKGGRLVFHNSFDPDRINKEIRDGFDGCISLVPTQLKSLIEHNVDLSRLQTVLVGGGKLSQELKQTCEEQNISTHNTYGMTETFGGICHDGTLFDNAQIKTIDDEIYIKSGSLFDSYRHDIASTFAKMSNGWFKTNDRGEIKDDKLSIWGRSDDVINSGGIKIDPNIIEKHMVSNFPNFIGFVGKTDHPKFGQCCTVFVEVDDLFLEGIRDQLSNSLPKTHIPLRVAVVPKIFYSSTGKLKRNLSSAKYDISQEHKVV